MTGTTTSGQETRSRLLETAAELLWRRSFHAAGVDEICRSAGVQRGSFYHFFPSKTDLAIEAIRARWRRMSAEIFDPVWAAGRSGLATLRVLADEVDRYQRGEYGERGIYLGCPFGAIGQEMAHQDERVQAAIDEVMEGHVDYFRRALERGVAAGEIAAGDLDARARALLALLQGALLTAKIANSPDRFTQAIRALPLVAAADAASPD